MTAQQDYLLKTVKEMTRTYKSRLVTIPQIFNYIENKAGREVDKGQVGITLAELVKLNLVQMEIQKISSHPDQEKVETPLFYSF